MLFESESEGVYRLLERGVRLKSNRRNGFDIAQDILQVCVHGANKTHIVYAANLNSKRINSHLEFCERMKLLTKQSNGGNFVYYTTPEGVHFLRNYFGAPQGQNVAQIR
jgi:predicted transcriptional regulator